MIKYDPAIIYEHADRLYKRAMHITAIYTFLGFVLGCIIGLFFLIICIAIGIFKEEPSIGSGVFFGVIGLFFITIIGIATGYENGKEKSFELKLKAQTILCQAMIEENTRYRATASPQVLPPSAT